MFSNLRFTPAITFVIHTFLSLLAGALASGLAAAGLAITQPNVNLSIVVGAGLAAFSAWFVHGFIALRNSPQFGQAERDGLAQAQAQLAQLAQSHQGLVNDVKAVYQQVVALAQAPAPVVAPVQAPQPIVMPPAPSSTNLYSVAQPQTIQVPFPAQVAQPSAFSRQFDTGVVPVVPPTR